MYDFGRFNSFFFEFGKNNVFGQYICYLQISDFLKVPCLVLMCDVFLAIGSCSKTIFFASTYMCVFVILRYVGSCGNYNFSR